jgi:hypothetical protein
MGCPSLGVSGMSGWGMHPSRFILPGRNATYGGPDGPQGGVSWAGRDAGAPREALRQSKTRNEFQARRTAHFTTTAPRIPYPHPPPTDGECRNVNGECPDVTRGRDIPPSSGFLKVRECPVPSPSRLERMGNGPFPPLRVSRGGGTPHSPFSSSANGWGTRHSFPFAAQERGECRDPSFDRYTFSGECGIPQAGGLVSAAPGPGAFREWARGRLPARLPPSLRSGRGRG